MMVVDPVVDFGVAYILRNAMPYLLPVFIALRSES